jgi:hypothetical protein
MSATESKSDYDDNAPRAPAGRLGAGEQMLIRNGRPSTESLSRSTFGETRIKANINRNFLRKKVFYIQKLLKPTDVSQRDKSAFHEKLSCTGFRRSICFFAGGTGTCVMHRTMPTVRQNSVTVSFYMIWFSSTNEVLSICYVSSRRQETSQWPWRC